MRLVQKESLCAFVSFPSSQHSSSSPCGIKCWPDKLVMYLMNSYDDEGDYVIPVLNMSLDLCAPGDECAALSLGYTPPFLLLTDEISLYSKHLFEQLFACGLFVNEQKIPRYLLDYLPFQSEFSGRRATNL